MEIIPAIMPQDITELRNKLALIRGLVETVQLDLMDGRFVKAKSWPYNGKEEHLLSRILNEEEGLPFWDEFNFELDLMVAHAKDELDMFMRFGARRLVFHFEAEDQIDDAFKNFLEGIDLYIRENVEIGVAINTTTPIEKIFPLVPHVDFVQCMGIGHIGQQGEPFDERVISHIAALREEYPDLSISVDGAVNHETIERLAEAGATRFVVGSAIWKNSEPGERIRELKKLVG